MAWEHAILAGGCFVAAFASGMAGFAFNLIAAGILFHWLPPQETAPVLVLGSLLIQAGTLRVVLPLVRWSVLRPYLIGGVLGTPFGVLVLRLASAEAIATGMGAVLVLYAGYSLARLLLRRRPHALRAPPAADAGIGFVAGAMGGIGGFSGALPVMWGDLKGLPAPEARAIFQPFIVAMQVVAAIGLVAGGFFGWETLWRLLATLPALALGGWLGVRAYRVIPASAFRVVLLCLLLLSGLSLVI